MESDPGSNSSSASNLPYDFVSLLQAAFFHFYKMWIISQVVEIWGEIKLVSVYTMQSLCLQCPLNMQIMDIPVMLYIPPFSKCQKYISTRSIELANKLRWA